MGVMSAPDFLFSLKFPEQNIFFVSSSMLRILEHVTTLSKKQEYRGAHFLIHEMGKPLMSGTVSLGGEIRIFV